jgi:HTH-like domain
MLMRLIGEQFRQTAWYGSRQMAGHLRREGYRVGRKRVRRLMAKMGLEPIYQRPCTSRTSDPSVFAAGDGDRPAENATTSSAVVFPKSVLIRGLSSGAMLSNAGRPDRPLCREPPAGLLDGPCATSIEVAPRDLHPMDG